MRSQKYAFKFSFYHSQGKELFVRKQWLSDCNALSLISLTFNPALLLLSL